MRSIAVNALLRRLRMFSAVLFDTSMALNVLERKSRTVSAMLFDTSIVIKPVSRGSKSLFAVNINRSRNKSILKPELKSEKKPKPNVPALEPNSVVVESVTAR